MKCFQCDAWSDVLETRGGRRRRECANGHRFTTIEVPHQVAERKPSVSEQAARLVISEGIRVKEAAQRLGLRSDRHVYEAIKRLEARA